MRVGIFRKKAAYTQGAADAFCGGLYYSGPHVSDYLKGARDAELAARGIGPLAALGNMGRKVAP